MVILSVCACACNDHDPQKAANVKSIGRVKWKAYRNQSDNKTNNDNSGSSKKRIFHPWAI